MRRGRPAYLAVLGVTAYRAAFEEPKAALGEQQRTIGTTRIWLQLFGLAGLDFASSFGPAFWISFSLLALIAELWLRVFPNPPELATSRWLRARVSTSRALPAHPDVGRR